MTRTPGPTHLGVHALDPGIAVLPVPPHLEVIVAHLVQLEDLMCTLTQQLVAMRAQGSAMLGRHLSGVDALYLVGNKGDVTLVHRRPKSTILAIEKVGTGRTIKQILTPPKPLTKKELADLANEETL